MNKSWLKWPVFVLLCFIWGSSFILMKASREGLSGVQIGGLRIFSAAIVCLPIAWMQRRHFSGKQWRLLFLAGLCGNLLPAFLFALAVTRIDSSLAGILNSLTPLTVLCIVAWVFRDRIAAHKWWGVIIGLAGLCILTLTRSQVEWSHLGYASLVLLATVFYGFNVNLVSHQLKGAPALPIASVSVAMMLVPAGLVLWMTGFFHLPFGQYQVQQAVLNSTMLGVVSSAIATVLFYWLVQKAGGLFASLVTYGIPFVALFWGLLDHETIGIGTVIGLGIILAGVYLANWKKAPSLHENGDQRI